MVRLHLLGFTHDLKGVVFTERRGAKTATFWVPIDASFLSALDKLEQARSDRDREGVSTTKRTKNVVNLKDVPAKPKVILPPVGRSQARSGLPASEIQQMLRTGRSVKSVAAAAKTPIAWVERLAEPVLAERIGVVRLAQRAYMIRPRLGTSGLQLGDAVERNLEERVSADGLDEVWDAKSGAAGTWRVWVRYSHRGKRRSAEWVFKKGSRQIAPRNRLAAQLGWWTPEPAAAAESQPSEDGEAGAEGQEAPTSGRPTLPRSALGRTEAKPARRVASSRTKKTSKRAPARKKPAKKTSGRPASRRPATRRKR